MRSLSPCGDSSANPSFPSQPEGKIGLPRANPRVVPRNLGDRTPLGRPEPGDPARSHLKRRVCWSRGVMWGRVAGCPPGGGPGVQSWPGPSHRHLWSAVQARGGRSRAGRRRRPGGLSPECPSRRAPGRLAGTCGPSRLEVAGPGRARGSARGGSVQNVRLEGYQVIVRQVGDVGRRVVPVLQLSGELAPALKPARGGRR